jgi:hypothetical protein
MSETEIIELAKKCGFPDEMFLSEINYSMELQEFVAEIRRRTLEEVAARYNSRGSEHTSAQVEKELLRLAQQGRG